MNYKLEQQIVEMLVDDLVAKLDGVHHQISGYNFYTVGATVSIPYENVFRASIQLTINDGKVHVLFLQSVTHDGPKAQTASLNDQKAIDQLITRAAIYLRRHDRG